jgi:hypothetical protein
VCNTLRVKIVRLGLFECAVAEAERYYFADSIIMKEHKMFLSGEGIEGKRNEKYFLDDIIT